MVNAIFRQMRLEPNKWQTPKPGAGWSVSSRPDAFSLTVIKLRNRKKV